MILLIKKIHSLYDEYFRVIDNVNIDEKKFYTKITTYVLAIFLCLFCIGFSSYFLFSFNNVQNEFCYPDTDVVIFDELGQVVIESPVGGYSLSADKKYTITLSQSADSNVDTYYCQLSLISNSGNSLLTTSQISKKQCLTFTLETSDDLTVDFYAKPGTNIYFNSDYVINENETITF